MALTDRQNAFYKRIHALLSLSSSVSLEERGYLGVAYDELQKGRDFKKVINDLNLRYKELESWSSDGTSLTPGSRKLRDDLVRVYGEPKGMIDNWKESDSEYVFRQRAWVKRGESPFKTLKVSEAFNFMILFLLLILITAAILFLFHYLGLLV
ncbi:hypothetical protein [Lactovum odontotermitis]